MIAKSGAKDGIKILNASLEETTGGDFILRGVIATESLSSLKVDDYQREVLSRSGVGGRGPGRLRKGIEAGCRLPDVELGMRGQNFTSSGKAVFLHDPVYIIDGLQRISALMDHIADHGTPNGAQPLGAAVHFKTTKQGEKERFAALNGPSRTPVSPGVLLRNIRDKHPSILTLYGLSRNDPSFALYQRVCWDQRMKQQELIKALMLVRAVFNLHKGVNDRVLKSHGALKRNESDTGMNKGAAQLDRIAKEVSLSNFRENVKDFFDLIDQCWGIKSIEYGEAQGHLKGNFMNVLGSFFAANEGLWTNELKRIKIDSQTLGRFRSFPVNDPEVRRLAGAGSTSAEPLLYKLLLDHMNKHKSKNRFK